MKRIIATLLAALLICIVALARQPQRGYRGFIEWSNNLRTETNYASVNETWYYSGLTTSHGYQINPIFFVGAGIGIEYSSKFNDWLAPLFAQCRADFEFGRFTPFADLRAGYNLSQGGGIYFSPSIGYRISWGRKAGINLGLGLNISGYKYHLYDISPTPEGYMSMTHIGDGHSSNAYFTFRVGFDF